MIIDQNVVFVFLISTLDRVAKGNILCDYYTMLLSESIMTKKTSYNYSTLLMLKSIICVET